jgi:hypothetical protein
MSSDALSTARRFARYYHDGRSHPVIGHLTRWRSLLFAWQMTRWMLKYGDES